MITSIKAFALTLAVFFALSSNAQQANYFNGESVADYVQNVLLGDGVLATNITYNGLSADSITFQVGEFTSSGYIEFGCGMVMSTGNVIGEDFLGNSIQLGEQSTVNSMNTYVDDVDLAEIALPLTLGEVIQIEFDFVSEGDSINVDYIFGSEEYPTFVNSNFNDAFGFFLSGPGITGPYSSPAGFPDGSQNIAIIPGVGLPVTIDNVNNGDGDCYDGPMGPCTNCEFYIDNCPIDEFALSGQTVPLRASASVIAGETYHIKLSIADVGDQSFDSAVFFESGSFTSFPDGLDLESVFPLALIEISDACDTGFASIRRPCAGDTIFYNLNYLVNDSTAEYGVDYEPLPLELMMLPNQFDTVFPILTILDEIEEDIEYICIEITESNNMDGPFSQPDTVCLAIIDNYTYPIAGNPAETFCPETQPIITVFANGPSVPMYEFYFLNADGDTVNFDNTFEVPVPPNQGDTTFYTVHSIDACGALSDPFTTYSTNLIPPDPTATITQPGDFCPGLDYVLEAGRMGGTFPITYEWSSPDGFSAPSDSSELVLSPNISPTTAGSDPRTYQVTVTDACTPGRQGSATIVVEYPDPLVIDLLTDSVICVEEELDFEVIASGGYQPYNIVYTVDGVADVQFTTDPTTGNGFATGFLYDTSTPENNEYVITATLNDKCTTNGQVADAAASYYTEDNVEEIDVLAITCIIPNVITPNGDDMNERFEAIEMINKGGRMYVYNRWGNEVVSTRNYFAEMTDQPAGTYFYVIDFADGETKKGSFTLLK